MNLFLVLIPQSLNTQFLNLAPYNEYDEDDVQKTELFLRSNNEVYTFHYVFFCAIIIALLNTIQNEVQR